MPQNEKPFNYDSLPTEQAPAEGLQLDTLSEIELVDHIHRQDLQALAAVGAAREKIAAVIRAASAKLAAGGRLIYLGAGTSGRLGVLDAAECPPTFGAPSNQVLAVIAGGAAAVERAIEGAEDDGPQGVAAMDRLTVGPADLVCAISASGITPFVIAALAEARRRGAHTALVTCGPLGVVANKADLIIDLAVGAETVAGSTRMKAGLATKAVLHTLSTAVMIRLGKVYDTLMVDLQPTNAKLRRRACRIVCQLTGLAPEQAEALLRRADYSPKIAVVMHHRCVDAQRARQLIAEHGGHLRRIIGDFRHGR